MRTVASDRFVLLDSATLAEMRTDWRACLKAIATAHQSYSIGGRTFTRANLSEVASIVADIEFALAIKAKTLARETHADMSS